jgi:hypothetical protein
MICTHCGKKYNGKACYFCGKPITISRPFQVPNPIQPPAKKRGEPLSIVIKTRPPRAKNHPIDTRPKLAPRTYEVARRTKCMKCESKKTGIKTPIDKKYLCSTCFNHPDCKWYECINQGCSVGFPAVETPTNCVQCMSSD